MKILGYLWTPLSRRIYALLFIGAGLGGTIAFIS